MNKKKLFIIILLIIAVFIFSILIIKKIENQKIINNDDITITKTSDEKIINDISISQSSISETTNTNIDTTTTSISTTKENKTTNSTTKVIRKETTTKSTSSTTIRTLSCPSGYSLINNMCTITIDANYVCPKDTHETTDDKCVSFTGSIPADGETCPPGYKSMLMITIGSPDRYDCLPLYNKIYKCDDGYTLHDVNKCSKTISPQ